MADNERCPTCGQELLAGTRRGPGDAGLPRDGIKTAAARSLDPGSSEETSAPGGTGSTGSPPIVEGPGSHIGPYRLLQEIGEGGMGVVYMAEQEKPVRRRVALKIIKPGMDTSQVIARFEAERQALALMDHQHIAKVLDAGATETGRPYFVMELVRGVPITEYCDRNQLTPKERLELFVPVCNAIQHAHQKGIIHRDIKPSNVLVTLYDGKPVAKVIDFGVAKATDQRLTERTMFTQFGQIVGTLEYMSPEQAEMGVLDIDSRSDIYSLGVVLYELLTGSTPLQRARLKQAAYIEILRRIRDDDTPKPSTRLSDSKESLATISAQRKTEPARLRRLVRGELDWIVMRALEKDRVRRYDTANALARDIQRYLAGDPVEASPPSATYRLRKFARKYRPWLFAAAAFAGLMLTATGVSGWQAVRATRAEKEAQEERNRALDAEKVAKEQTERALAAERIALAELERVADQTRRIKDATVRLNYEAGGKTLASGTGFVIEATGETVLLATNRHVASPEPAEAAGHLVPQGSRPEIEAVFSSGQGPSQEQTQSAQLIAADASDELGTDLAFLIVKGVKQPPAPINTLNRLDPAAGMACLGAGFPKRSAPGTAPEGKGNPPVTIVRGGISAVMHDERGQLTSIRMDDGLIPGDGCPIVEERTGTLIGVAVSQANRTRNLAGVAVTKPGSTEQIGSMIPADLVRRALAGRVSGLDVTIESIQKGTADLLVNAQVIDPKSLVKAVLVSVVGPIDSTPLAPYSDGSWPPLQTAPGVELKHDPDRASATGHVRVLLSAQDAESDRFLIQTAHRYQSGQLVYSEPKAYILPARPGRIYPIGTSLQTIVKSARRESFALLGKLNDPDKDCLLRKDERTFTIKIEVPCDTLHTLSPEMFRPDKTGPLHNAPTIMTDVEGDFAAIVEVTGEISATLTPPEDRMGNEISATFQGAGLLLYQDQNNFVRLERTARVAIGSIQPAHKILLEVVKDGKEVESRKFSVAPDGPAYLVLLRRKGRVVCAAGRDLGAPIVPLAEIEINLLPQVKVGLSASNISAAPLAATFQNFALLRDTRVVESAFGNRGREPGK